MTPIYDYRIVRIDTGEVQLERTTDKMDDWVAIARGKDLANLKGLRRKPIRVRFIARR